MTTGALVFMPLRRRCDMTAAGDAGWRATSRPTWCESARVAPARYRRRRRSRTAPPTRSLSPVRSRPVLPIAIALAITLAVAACGGRDEPGDTPRPPDERRDSAGAVGTGTPASPALVVTEHGLGPLRVGTTVRDAMAALGDALALPAGADTSECSYLSWRGGPPGVRVMAARGRVARVEVEEGSDVPTEAGARIGDSEARIDSLYAGRVTVSPHKYTSGRYLTIRPAAPADSAYRIVFETDGRRVVRYRAGVRPPVEWVEGCG